MIRSTDVAASFTDPGMPLKAAMEKLQSCAFQILLIRAPTGHLDGIITEGDVRQALLNALPMTTAVCEIMNIRFHRVYEDTPEDKIAHLFRTYQINQIPILDWEGKVIGLIGRGNIPSPWALSQRQNSHPVVIMAGGKGTRLDPLTRILPKPMIPFGEKPLIEIIMQKFHSQGFRDFILSVNYKREIIQLYFRDRKDLPFSVSFVEEDFPLGTAGSLALMRDRLRTTFLVSNCDVLLEADFGRILETHRKQGNGITIVGSFRHMQIPYGVINLNHGEFQDIQEKPEFDFMINTGVYVLEPDVIDRIPQGQAIDMPDLIRTCHEAGVRVGVHPVYQSWFDLGQWDTYRKTIAHLDLFS